MTSQRLRLRPKTNEFVMINILLCKLQTDQIDKLTTTRMKRGMLSFEGGLTDILGRAGAGGGESDSAAVISLAHQMREPALLPSLPTKLSRQLTE